MSETEKVTLTLPKIVMESVREMAPARGYSKFVAEAVEFYVAEKKRQTLRERLIEGYLANAETDRALAQEWESTAAEVWETFVPPYEGEEPEDDAQDS